MTRKILAFFTALMILFTQCAVCYNNRENDAELRAYISELCDEYLVPPELVFAMIERESTWNADAFNASSNCIGLMQIATVNLGWLGRELGVSDLYDPYQNVLAGVTMIGDYIAQYGDLHKALMCYNCGESGAKKQFANGIYASAYSRWIVNRMGELMEERGGEEKEKETACRKILAVPWTDSEAQKSSAPRGKVIALNEKESLCDFRGRALFTSAAAR